MLQLINIKKLYNSNLVLDIPGLSLDNGIYWVKGANGSGKTTLLKMVAGLLPFQGDILLNTTSLQHQPLAYRQSVSWSEAEPLYPSFLTGTHLLSLYQSIRQAPRQEVNDLLEAFQMKTYVNNTIDTYSAGMTKKLSLVLAFLGNTPLVVLDEPLITLDAEALSLLCTLIQEKHTRTGTGFLISSHQEPDSRLFPSGRELIVSHQTIMQP